MSNHFYPARIFTDRPELSQDACNELAAQILVKPVMPVKPQGAFSYTVESTDPDQIVQFRSPPEQFDTKIIALAKAIYGDLVPDLKCHGLLPGSDIGIWTMEKLPGAPLVYIHLENRDADILPKLKNAVSDTARFVTLAELSI